MVLEIIVGLLLLIGAYKCIRKSEELEVSNNGKASLYAMACVIVAVVLISAIAIMFAKAMPGI